MDILVNSGIIVEFRVAAQSHQVVDIKQGIIVNWVAAQSHQVADIVANSGIIVEFRVVESHQVVDIVANSGIIVDTANCCGYLVISGTSLNFARTKATVGISGRLSKVIRLRLAIAVDSRHRLRADRAAAIRLLMTTARHVRIGSYLKHRWRFVVNRAQRFSSPEPQCDFSWTANRVAAQRDSSIGTSATCCRPVSSVADILSVARRNYCCCSTIAVDIIANSGTSDVITVVAQSHRCWYSR